ncbi:ARM repeat-containing protein [Cucurbitaria berberidis CBS 394.84]|uniref:ARM repeat-containing protein n=1 Tax=Cucurbitaria berberidis CBS 394.84 TaxID=1168544 RepID=A0A9P4L7V1_9PLEO|nr:ARM repeat-containing protein [Cucurbitaria berberidis CBS 394.84]KAF1844702.1 ARM repeat-containing protein [Cucurbitaria berberidis CBS 394.84]
MGRSTIPLALNELSNPSTPEAQVAALQNLKNEIVGHEQRKELAVTHGVVKPLAGLLRAEARKGGKRRRNVTNGHGSGLFSETRRNLVEWTTEDELRFQATLVAGSLANGGPAFIAPLLAGDILPPLLEALRPSETPSKLVTTTLKSLNQIVDAVAQEKPWVDMSDTSSRSSLAFAVNEQIYTKQVIESLAEILAQVAGTTRVNQQIESTVRLIMKTCREDCQKKLLVDAGILDLLAEKLAAVAATDDSLPDTKQSTHDKLPSACMPDILEAISAIIKDSHFYTARFLYSQPIQQLFGWPKERSAAYDGHSSSSQSNTWDKLIPRVQTMASKSDPYTKSWPALGAYNPAVGESNTRLPSMESLQQTSSRSVITDESESPLFIWLMYVARRGEGRERLAACWLLALLKKFGERWPLNDPSKTTRERHFSYLIVPLVVKMIEDSSPTSEQAKRANNLSPTARDEMRFVLERSPLVLAELIGGNKPLQSAAVDARILPTLVQILKKSFDIPATSSKPLWQPRSSHEVKDTTIDPASSTLGRPGLSADVLHAFKYRESVLLALAAIAGDQDGYRKLVIEMGAATQIIEALVPYTESNEPGAPSTIKDGNPDTVLIAACKVTRSLSRSVSVLRTSLIDHGVAQPVFDLLTHPSVKVQIAATEVITNLVLEVSPMRTEILESGVLKTLCEQCRSANFDLRFGSLWALKHLCLGLPQMMKMQCLEELGVGWLVQVLNGEPSKPTMATPNAAGEQVDILNAVDEPHMDVDDELSSEEDEDAMTESIPSLRRHQRPGSRYTSATNIRDRLQQIKNDEQDTRLNGERDDIRIQEQALDFIRNFVSEDKASGEMIDHLLKTFGHSRFFEILDAKVRPKNISSSTSTAQTQPSPGTTSFWPNSNQRLSFPSSTPTPSQQPNWSLYPATELILATVFILVHLANGRPAHRSLLISQTALMQHVLPLFVHPRREIRVACAWVIHNLVWVEDHTDEPATRERIQTLRQLGYEDGAKLLGRDMDLDIRERAKTSIEQFAKFGGDQGRGGYGNPAQGFGGAESGMGGLAGMGGRFGGLHGGWRQERG